MPNYGGDDCGSKSWERETKDLPQQVAAVKGSEHQEDDEVAMVRKRGEPRKGVSVLGKESRAERIESDWSQKEELECWKCGRCHRPRQCPAFGQKCLKCNGFNHFARKCKVRSRPTQLMQELEPEELLQVKVEKKGKKIASKVLV